MKYVTALFFGLFFFGIGGFDCAAQNKTVTVVIFRHADKEPEIDGDESDPDISVDGQKRAVRLARMLEKYRPTRLFSTRYARAVQTVTPLSRLNNLPIEFYEPGDQQALVDRILASETGRRVAVVGHNSTAYQLANLFLKSSKYTMPEESDYGKIWILKIRNGKVVDQVIVY